MEPKTEVDYDTGEGSVLRTAGGFVGSENKSKRVTRDESFNMMEDQCELHVSLPVDMVVRVL